MPIRPATAADVPAIAAIYDHHVEHSVATFDLEPQGGALWQEKVDATGAGARLLVAEEDGAVVGFAYSSPFRHRPAYSGTRETSTYLSPEADGRGLGRQLYDALLERLAADGIHTVIAVVAQPNPASTALHRRCGFTEVGTLREVGRKHGRLVDITWWQRHLGDSPAPPPPRSTAPPLG